MARRKKFTAATTLSGFLACFFAACILLCANVRAESEPMPAFDMAEAECIGITPEQGRLINEQVRAAGLEAPREEADADETGVYASYNFSTDYFYNALTADGKKFYNALKKACDALLTSTANFSADKWGYGMYPFCEGIQVPLSLASGGYYSTVYNLFYYSNPQYFFLSNGFLSYVTTAGGEFWPVLESCFRNYSERKKYKDAINKLTDEWMKEINAAEETLEKEEIIYKKLAAYITYKYKADGRTPDSEGRAQTIAGALVDKTCVCNGYSMAAAYFLNAAGIECITVRSVQHAWNVVLLYDNWYGLDVTWADATYLDTRWVNKSYETFRKQDATNIHNHWQEYYGKIALPSYVRDTVYIPVTLISLKLHAPDRTEYFTGDKLDLTGGYIVAEYSDGRTESLALNDELVNVTGFSSESAGTRTIKVTFGGKSVYFSVTVSDLKITSLKLAAAPTKTDYYTGDKLDLSDGLLRAYYNNGTGKNIALSNKNVKISGFDSSRVGECRITAEFEGMTVSFTVNIEERPLILTGVELGSFTWRLYVGDELDPGTITLILSYDNSTTKEITAAAEGVKISGFDSLTPGNKEITVSYMGYTVKYTATVYELEVMRLEVEAEPEVQNMTGAPLDLTGGVLKITYNNYKTGTVPMTSEEVGASGYDINRVGDQEITLTYGGKSVTLVINVLFDESKAVVFLGEKGYPSIADALSAVKAAGNYTISITDAHTETKKIKLPSAEGAAITLDIAEGAVLTLLSPTVAASSDLTIKGDVSCGKGITIKASAGRTLTLAARFNAPKLTLRGTSSSKLILEADLTAASVSGFAAVNTGEHELKATGPVKIAGTLDGRLTAGKKTTIGTIGTAYLTIPAEYAEKTFIGGISGRLTVKLTGAHSMDASPQLFTYKGKAEDFYGLDIEVADKDSKGRTLNAFLYKTAVRAQLAGAVSLDGRDFPGIDAALSAMTDAAEYTLTINEETVAAERLALPTKAISVRITGGGSQKTINLARGGTVGSKCALILENIRLVSGEKPVSVKAAKSSLTLINSEIGSAKAAKLTVNGSVTINGAAAVGELCSDAEGTSLTLRSLSVKKNGITAGSAVITLSFINADGSKKTFAPGNTVVSKMKPGYTEGSLVLDDGGKLVFENNKIVLA